MHSHLIRLRGMWRVESVHQFVQDSNGERKVVEAATPPSPLTDPNPWQSTLPNDFHGRCRLRRRFHAPTGIGPNDQVALVFEHTGVVGNVEIDGHFIGEFNSLAETQVFQHDIRPRLKGSHELTIAVESRHSGISPHMGTVRLEIQSAIANMEASPAIQENLASEFTEDSKRINHEGKDAVKVKLEGVEPNSPSSAH